ncbi:MAG: CoA transferase [Proteobacteria bacterium]|nr:CoA transferase [Pseudomonadota bacterium]
MSDDDLAFRGVKVLDASQGVAGPHCGMLLAQHGAEVVKLEPLAGDWGRAIGKQHGQHCAHSIPFNRGKKSIALDFKSAEGLAIAKKLASEADVILENYRPGVMARFGLDYPTVTKGNPSVVYLSITGFGQEGPNANLPATDSVMQAYSGLMSATRDAEGMPTRVGLLAIDISTGLYAFQAVAPALYRKAMTGKGKRIATSLMEAIGAFQAAKMVEYQLEGDAVLPSGVPVGTFECSDGYININGRRDAHYVAFCKVIGRDDLATDPRYATVAARFENEAELMVILREGAKKLTVAELHAALNDGGVLNAPVHDYGDYFNDPHVKAVNAVQWLDHADVGRIPFPNIPGLPPARQGDPLAHSPYIGEHSREVLRGIGYDDSAIDALGASGAVGIWEQAQAAD